MGTQEAAVAKRRQQTREAMQRLRERRQRGVEQLRRQVQALEATHARLLRRIEERQFIGEDRLTWPLPSLQLEEAKECTEALVAANARLKEAIDAHERWEDHVKLLLHHLPADNADEDSEGRLRESRPLPLATIVTPPLTESRAYDLMRIHHKKRKAIKRQWLLTERAPLVSEFFGWEILYFPKGRHWHLKFTKVFRNVSAHAVSTRAWGNAQRLVNYRARVPSRVLAQRIDENAFVFAWWTCERDHFIQSNRVQYMLRFRVEKPDGTVGIGMQAVPEPGENRAMELDDRLLSVEDECLYIKITPVKDDATGEEHCVIQYSGRTQLGDPAYAQRNALELIISLARWEEINVAAPPVPMEWS